MNRFRISPLPRALPAFAIALVASTFVPAAEDPAQRQLRQDRERFQREVERQSTDAKIRDDQARIAAEQQRTTDELERLRTQQSRQSSDLRNLSETTRTTTRVPTVVPSPRIATPSSAADYPATSAAAITPDFSVTFLADGNCVVYIKGCPPEVRTALEAEKTFRSLADTKSKPSERPAASP